MVLKTNLANLAQAAKAVGSDVVGVNNLLLMTH